ncbi:hypothetical protein XENOCAPTIV_028043, partial [Xenoophorus captivus]
LSGESPFQGNNDAETFSLVTAASFEFDPEKPVWSREAEAAIQSLDKQLQTEPHFQQALKDITLPKRETAQLTCLVDGTDKTAMLFIDP